MLGGLPRETPMFGGQLSFLVRRVRPRHGWEYEAGSQRELPIAESVTAMPAAATREAESGEMPERPKGLPC